MVQVPSRQLQVLLPVAALSQSAHGVAMTNTRRTSSANLQVRMLVAAPPCLVRNAMGKRVLELDICRNAYLDRNWAGSTQDMRLGLELQIPQVSAPAEQLTSGQQNAYGD